MPYTPKYKKKIRYSPKKNDNNYISHHDLEHCQIKPTFKIIKQQKKKIHSFLKWYDKDDIECIELLEEMKKDLDFYQNDFYNGNDNVKEHINYNGPKHQNNIVLTIEDSGYTVVYWKDIQLTKEYINKLENINTSGNLLESYIDYLTNLQHVFYTGGALKN